MSTESIIANYAMLITHMKTLIIIAEGAGNFDAAATLTEAREELQERLEYIVNGVDNYADK